MARINYPSKFIYQAELYKDIKAKHDTDGTSSVLSPFLKEENIDLAAGLSQIDYALECDKQAKSLSLQSEELMTERNKLFDLVFDDHRGCVQFLKKLYDGNTQKLGDWGVTIDDNDRVIYPADFLSKVNMVSAFIEKHLSFATGTSPLEPFLAENEIDLAANHSKASISRTSFESAEQKLRDQEEKNEQRDRIMKSIMSQLRGIGGYLESLFPDNPRQAGEWGFVIDSAPLENKDRTIGIGANSVKTIYNLVPGSTVINLGTTDFSIFPGKDIDAEPVQLPSGQTFVIARKYGTSTFLNNSHSQEGMVEVTVIG